MDISRTVQDHVVSALDGYSEEFIKKVANDKSAEVERKIKAVQRFALKDVRSALRDLRQQDEDRLHKARTDARAWISILYRASEETHHKAHEDPCLPIDRQVTEALSFAAEMKKEGSAALQRYIDMSAKLPGLYKVLDIQADTPTNIPESVDDPELWDEVDFAGLDYEYKRLVEQEEKRRIAVDESLGTMVRIHESMDIPYASMMSGIAGQESHLEVTNEQTLRVTDLSEAALAQVTQCKKQAIELEEGRVSAMNSINKKIELLAKGMGITPPRVQGYNESSILEAQKHFQDLKEKVVSYWRNALSTKFKAASELVHRLRRAQAADQYASYLERMRNSALQNIAALGEERPMSYTNVKTTYDGFVNFIAILEQDLSEMNDLLTAHEKLEKLVNREVTFRNETMNPARLLEKRGEPGRLLMEEKMRKYFDHEVPRVAMELEYFMSQWRSAHPQGRFSNAEHILSKARRLHPGRMPVPLEKPRAVKRDFASIVYGVPGPSASPSVNLGVVVIDDDDAETGANQASDRVADRVAARIAEQARNAHRASDGAEGVASRVLDGAAERVSDRVAAERVSGRGTDGTAKRVSDRVTDRAAERISDRVTDRAAGNAADKAVNQTPVQATERAKDQSTNKAPERRAHTPEEQEPLAKGASHQPVSAEAPKTVPNYANSKIAIPKRKGQPPGQSSASTEDRPPTKGSSCVPGRPPKQVQAPKPGHVPKEVQAPKPGHVPKQVQAPKPSESQKAGQSPKTDQPSKQGQPPRRGRRRKRRIHSSEESYTEGSETDTSSEEQSIPPSRMTRSRSRQIQNSEEEDTAADTSSEDEREPPNRMTRSQSKAVRSSEKNYRETESSSGDESTRPSHMTRSQSKRGQTSEEDGTDRGASSDEEKKQPPTRVTRLRKKPVRYTERGTSSEDESTPPSRKAGMRGFEATTRRAAPKEVRTLQAEHKMPEQQRVKTEAYYGRNTHDAEADTRTDTGYDSQSDIEIIVPQKRAASQRSDHAGGSPLSTRVKRARMA